MSRECIRDYIELTSIVAATVHVKALPFLKHGTRKMGVCMTTFLLKWSLLRGQLF